MPSSPKSTILLLGGTGKISSRIAPLLSAAGYTTLLASRSGTVKSPLPNCRGVRFDWFDSTTWSAVFTTHPHEAIFLIAPPILDCVPLTKAFISLSLSHNIRRIVLLSGSLFDVGDGPNLREISGYVAGLGIEYAILRPTWFMENFSEQEFLPSIRDEDRIVTAAGEGKVPFVSADDIAECAFKALTGTELNNKDHLILGPELCSYDEIAEMFTKALGRKITHVKISEDEAASQMEGWGIEPGYARMLAQLDTAVKDGKEERLNDVVLKITGHPPKKFEVYLGECIARGVWDKK